ncbi:MAG TPA: hypothetical protein GYA06_11445 [Chloroflexi bacterium]|nr:hypothetical protein [Chloroflexota bacterium]HPO58729.1 hypothetical protein [Anaerolineaceae bacterium]
MQRFHRFNPPEDGASPEQVRFLDLQVEPWPDGRRIKVLMSITPFLQPPNLMMVMTDAEGTEVSRTSIVENIDYQLVFTMHIRSQKVAGQYKLTASINYDDLGVVDERQVEFESYETDAEE